MFLDIILALICGICTGMFTGLTPGIHINLVNSILISVAPILLLTFTIPQIVLFIIAMSITHTFLDSLPSIFLGAPDKTTVLAVAPGHRYLLRGEGIRAFKLTLAGSFLAIIFSVLAMPAIAAFVSIAYPLIRGYVAYILIGFSAVLIIGSKSKSDALILFALSALLGYACTSGVFSEPLVPLLSGMFGLSSIILSIMNDKKIAEQKECNLYYFKGGVLSVFIGGFAGLITAIFPGIGASFATIIGSKLVSFIKSKAKEAADGFMMMLGSVNTFNFLLSIPMAYLFSKARNGSVMAISTITGHISNNLLILIIAGSLVSGCIAFLLSFHIQKLFVKIITKINYKLLSVIIAFTIIVISIVSSGLAGSIILAVSTSIGIYSSFVKAPKTAMMGCLIFPVIVWLI